MDPSHITINNQSGVSSMQSSGTPTAHAATEDYTQRAPLNLNHNFVSKVSRTLSLDSSIPAMPSMNTSTMDPIVPLHEVVISTPKSYVPSTQQIAEKGTSRLNSEVTSDLYFPSGLDFPNNLGHIGKEDKMSLHGGLKDPIWVAPTICTHQGTYGEMCFMCKKDMGNNLEKPEPRPDFTVLGVYGRTPRSAKKKCKFGTITTLTTCFSVFVLVFIMAFVAYNEVVSKQHRM